jgi:MoaA/NifB/PqqE/SkfB family radical SAM enzyme
MANTFCRYLSNGMRIQTYYNKQAALPCCMYGEPSVHLDDPKFNEKFSVINQRTNCFYCAHEKNSLRKQSFKEVQGDPPAGKIAYLELSVDMTCNAACLSCDDHFSSTWVAQMKKFKLKTEDDYPDFQKPEEIVEQLFNTIDFSYLQHLKFFGGEPFYADTTELFPAKFIEQYDSTQVVLSFVTNGSVRPSEHIQELIRKFKSVNISLSIDGVGEKFNYLRYPLKWEKVLDTIRYMQSLNIDRFIVSCTTSALNVNYCDEIISWADEFFKGDHRFHSVSFSICNGDLSLVAMTEELKQVVVRKYSEHRQLLEMLEPFPCIEDETKRMLNYVNKIDSLRNLSWKKTFPELTEYFI